MGNLVLSSTIRCGIEPAAACSLHQYWAILQTRQSVDKHGLCCLAMHEGSLQPSTYFADTDAPHLSRTLKIQNLLAFSAALEDELQAGSPLPFMINNI